MFTGDPVHSGEFLRALKRGRRDAGLKKCRSRVSDTKHNMAFSAHRHLHNAREEREVYFIVPATVPMLWKCMIKKVNCRFCVTRGGALLSFLTFT